ncbi:glycosyltransferase family 2 protein [Mycolicibacterium sp. P9-64]|nr:glycosyltransferase family 2 protein [Mycolicibacterium sp. P9-64]
MGDLPQLTSMCDTAIREGASPVVIANSSRLYRKLVAARIPHLTSRRNDGFAASVILGAEGDWDWLVILNDDLTFDPDDLAPCLSAQTLDALHPAAIVYFDDGSARHLPTQLGVLLSVSLLSNIARRAFPRWHRTRLEGTETFRAFSAVAIGRQVWDRVGGLDSRYPFSYEDADFVRRARALGVQVSAMRTGVVHQHSRTSGRFVTAVLPVATWSALEYLTKWFGKRTLHRWLLVFALGVRAPIAAATMPQPRKQIRAVANAARALVADDRPSLPEWESA